MSRMGSTRRGALAVAEPAIVASAARYPDGAAKLPTMSKAGWQTEGWRFYDVIGELRYIANYVGNILSRAILQVEQVADSHGRPLPAGPTVVTSGPAVDALATLLAEPASADALLKAYGIHMTIAGECYLIGQTISGVDIWNIYGVSEVDHSGKGKDVQWWLRDDAGNRNELKNAVVIRIWRPHPAFHGQADSPVRAVLPILQEIEYLTRHVFAQVQSRLAGAGILEIAQGTTFPVLPGTEGLGAADQFIRMLGDAMVKPIKDPANPASIVPIVVTTPDDLIGKSMNWTTFWSPLDQHSAELRSEAIRRLALGMEIPPEILLGQGEVNHWSGWLIDESAIKAHISPLLDLFTTALTAKYLRPALDDSVEFRVVADTSQMRLRPDHSQQAIELYDRGELDGEALRRENGFDEDDAPDDEQWKRWQLRKIAGGSATPEQVAAANKKLGIDLGNPTEAVPTRQSRPSRTLDKHPRREIPEEAAAASEALVFRALERAGNKMRSMYGVRPTCSAMDLYLQVPVRNGDLDRIMEDAWGSLPRTLSRFQVDCDWVQRGLDTYTRGLIVGQTPHDYEKMRGYLQAVS